MSQLVGVIIPCYNVKSHIMRLLSNIGNEVSAIYVVDDACPEHTGNYVLEHNIDPRVRILYCKQNMGVGGAVKKGFIQAKEDGMQILVKLDGDEQMDPTLIPSLIAPLRARQADYVKGNRFFNPRDVRKMPLLRIFGNLTLSFLTKLSSGYWNIFDPTNGFIAIQSSLLENIELDKIHNRYFFESDMLFRLNLAEALVIDYPMSAVYGKEKSNLNIRKVLFSFIYHHAGNTAKRVIYKYFIRDFSIASLELVFGLSALTFGLIFGITTWIDLSAQNIFASSGTVMLAVLPIFVGSQLLISFVNYDISSSPKIPRTSFTINDNEKT